MSSKKKDHAACQTDLISFRSKGSCTRDDDHFIKSAQVQTDSLQVQDSNPMTQIRESYIPMESIGTQCDQVDPLLEASVERPKTAKKKADIPDRPVFQNKFVRRPSSSSNRPISKSPAKIPEIEEDEFSTTRVTRSKSGQTPRSDEVIQKQNLPSNMKTIMVMDENFEFGEKMVPRTPLYAPTPKWQPDDSQSRDSFAGSRDSFSGSRDAAIKSPMTRSRSKILNRDSPADSKSPAESKSSECEKKFAVTVTRRSTVTTTSTPVRRIPTDDGLEDGELDSDSQSTQNSQQSNSQQSSQDSQSTASSQQNTSCASSQDSILDSTVINRDEPVTETSLEPPVVHRTPSNISLESHPTNSQGSSNFGGSVLSGNQGLFSGPEISDMSQDSKTMAWHREDKLREQNKENIPESLRLRNVIYTPLKKIIESI